MVVEPAKKYLSMSDTCCKSWSNFLQLVWLSCTANVKILKAHNLLSINLQAFYLEIGLGYKAKAGDLSSRHVRCQAGRALFVIAFLRQMMKQVSSSTRMLSI